MEIREESLSYLEEYARVPIAFEVSRILDLSVPDDGLGGFGRVSSALGRLRNIFVTRAVRCVDDGGLAPTCVE